MKSKPCSCPTQLFILFFVFWCSGSVYAQYTVSGMVTDEVTGEPIIGTNIFDPASLRGATTDSDGIFSIVLPPGDAELTFTFIGYLSQSIKVTGSTGDEITLNVQLKQDIANLEELVVSGLASSVKRSNLGNSVATISSEKLTGVTTQSTMDGALYGKLTGVNIVQSSGAPGGGIALRLRGVSSVFGNNQPLFIIDGVYMNNSEIPSGSRFASGANNGAEEGASNRIADLDPNDIENIEVLKGPSAAAIYGTRANAGVVIITTKRGRPGSKSTSIRFSQDTGFNTILNRVGRRSFAADQVELEFGRDERDAFIAAQNAGTLTNWEDEIYGETGLISETRLSMSGGNEKTSFYIGGSLRDEDGIVKNTGFNRNNIRINVDHRISPNLKVTSSSNFVSSEASRSFSGNENEGGLSYGYTLAFTRDWVNLFPDEFGNYPVNPNYPGNPLLTRDEAKNEESTNRFIQGLGIDWTLFSNATTSFRVRFNGGIDYFKNETFVLVPEFQQAQVGTTNGFIGIGNNESFNRNYQLFGVFDKYLSDFTLSTQAGISYLDFERDFTLSRTTQLIPGQTNATQGGAQQVTQALAFEEEFGMVLQQEINYGDKVILMGGIRFDKSSLNGDPNQYFAFPRASMAVNLANFDFWASSFVSSFKLRAAYGQTGNSPSFGALYTTFDATNIEGSPGVIIGLDRGVGDLEPETAQEIETGFDVGFADGKVGLEVTYYNKQIRNMLYERQLPSSSGFTFEIFNDADLTNQGIEVGINAQPVANQNVLWNSNLNFWLNRSELTRLEAGSIAPRNTAFGTGLGSFFMEEGEPITQLKGNTADGLQTIGDVEPDFQVGWYNTIGLFKNVQVNFLLHWKEGGDNLNLSRLLTDIGGTTPRDIQPLENPSFYIEDASYLRLREASVYYTFRDVSALSSVVQNIRVGVSGRNIFTITDYSSYDPEVSTKGGTGLSSGIEVTPFPSSKQFYVHVTFDF
ncbi:MAG: SusC/RagA family TonB-linked outer membrane protein [Bacteroidota bacterium]